MIVDAGSEFRTLSLQSIVPLDPNGDPLLVPAYQIDDLAYATATAQQPVPEPATVTLLLLGGGVLSRRRRRVAR